MSEDHRTKRKNYRRCHRCGKVKHHKEYHANRAKQDGICGYCRKCRAERYQEREKQAGEVQKRQFYYETARWVELRRQYGISRECYELMHEQQNGLCAICGQPETFKHKGAVRRLCVDHDHQTGKIRGLLCTVCNKGLGCFKDSASLLDQARNYLASHAGGVPLPQV